MMSGIHQAVVDNDCVDEFLVGYRNRAWSAKAWHREKHRFGNRQHLSDFRDGFRQGYEDVANGGDGRVPVIAPKSYWGWEYQSAEGQSKVGAWFSGYPLGAKAAEEDGIGYWGDIRTTLPMPAAMAPACATDVCAPGAGMSLDGAPTPADPAVIGSSALTAPPQGPVIGGENVIRREHIGPSGLGTIDIESLHRLPASAVPTAASGR